MLLRVIVGPTIRSDLGRLPMTTIRMVDPVTVGGKAKEIFDAALRRERKVFGATEISNIWRLHAWSSWSR